MSFECLRDKRANLFFCWSGKIQNVFGICPAMIKVLFSGWFLGSSEVSQKFRRSGVPAMVRSSDISSLTDLESSLWWSYRTCPVFIPDMSGICPAMVKLLFSGWFVGSSDVSWKFQRSEVPTMAGSSDVLHLTDLDGSLSWSYQTCLVWTTRGQRLVFKCLEGRKFRRESGVPTVGSSGMRREFQHLTNFNSFT